MTDALASELDPEPSGDEAGTWTGPALLPGVLLAGAAVALLLTAISAARVLLGQGPEFLAVDTQRVRAYTRIAYVVQVLPPERVLLLPAVALAASAWLLPRRPHLLLARRATAAVAAVLGVLALLLALAAGYLLAAAEPVDDQVTFFAPGGLLEALAPTVTGALLLAALAAALVRVLLAPVPLAPDRSPLAAARTGPPASYADPSPGTDRSAFQRPGGPVPAAPVADEDPHAPYRRPPARGAAGS